LPVGAWKQNVDFTVPESGERVSNNNVIRPESMIQDEYPAMILIVVCLLAYYFPRFRRLLLGPEDEFVR
jgi:hypothetical protein